MLILVRSIALVLLLLAFPDPAIAQGFKEKQQKYPRYRKALQLKSKVMAELFKEKEVAYPPRRVFIRIFKKEQQLELWALSKGKTYTLVKTYPFCYASGDLGPKRQQGDSQVPEGFYHINRFNPWSSYHLSLGINYPNKSDRILGVRRNLGGDIFIHGDCVSIGCVAITDDLIREVYIVTVEARNRGQRWIPVHLFPTRMNEEGMAALKAAKKDEKLELFWRNLKEGYDYFETKKTLPRVTVSTDGTYRYK